MMLSLAAGGTQGAASSDQVSSVLQGAQGKLLMLCFQLDAVFPGGEELFGSTQEMDSAFDLTVAHNSTHMLFYMETLELAEAGASKLAVLDAILESSINAE